MNARTDHLTDAATAELLAALDELYPLPDDTKRAERAGRTCAVLKRWMASKTSDLQAMVPRLVTQFLRQQTRERGAMNGER